MYRNIQHRVVVKHLLSICIPQLFVYNVLSYKSSLEHSVEAQCKYIVLTGHICLDLLYINVNVGKVMLVRSVNVKHIH